MNKKKKVSKEIPKQQSNGLVGGLIVLCVAVIFGFSGLAIAQIDFLERAAYYFGTALAEKTDAPILGSNGFLGSDSQDTTVLTALTLDEDLVVTGTTTQNILSFSSQFAKTLDFSANSTTTVGGLFSIQNTGDTKVCTLVELEISTADVLGGPTGVGASFAYRVATSTAAATWSNDSTLIASTTNATGTTELMNSGTNSNGTGVTAGGNFLWTAGVYINGVFDDAIISAGGAGNATSTSYTGQVGSVYITCHSR